MKFKQIISFLSCAEYLMQSYVHIPLTNFKFEETLMGAIYVWYNWELVARFSTQFLIYFQYIFFFLTTNLLFLCTLHKYIFVWNITKEMWSPLRERISSSNKLMALGDNSILSYSLCILCHNSILFLFISLLARKWHSLFRCGSLSTAS